MADGHDPGHSVVVSAILTLAFSSPRGWQGVGMLHEPLYPTNRGKVCWRTVVEGRAAEAFLPVGAPSRI